MAADRRRPQGTGSVYQRGDGKWVAQIDVGWTEHGRRRYARHTCRTKKEAQVELKKMISDRDKGVTTIDPRTTVKTWCDQWLETCQHRLSPASAAKYGACVRKWIIPTIGRKHLSQLTTRDLDKLTTAITDAGESPTTASNAASILRICLKAAAVAGHTVPMPILLAPLPRHAPSDRQAIPVADAGRILLAAANPQTWPPLPPRPKAHTAAYDAYRGELTLRATDFTRWMAALLGGIRQGEALGLEWDRVNFDTHSIDVSWQLSTVKPDTYIPPHIEIRRLHGSQILKRPKSSSGWREIPMVPWLETAMLDWKTRQPPGPHDLVWPGRAGQPANRFEDLQAWKALQRIAGVEKVSTGAPFVGHEARHTTVSILTELGVPEPVIVAIAGHSSIASTRAYQHVDLTEARAALQRVADRLQITA
ncbi:site-specific tyrosine recombinase XerC [Acidipropionibacterium jensenii]|uniref:Site-specific tyrosine recombinase XerC n=1 Tax=Acidipropionibacterium jensenii TaxID=1749 RepID=A0A3S4USF5_9ACTN|nr:site-specific integrase [Acidipropionibacterium jensenii]VEI04156.1 site-specific tyrosine recombinase XerC [Acidipropionibacterium jensenii]